MPTIDKYDFLVLGCGTAGKFMAWSAAGKGKKIAVIERGMIGGSCPNIACLPSKNVIYSAKVYELVRRAGEFGIATGPSRLYLSGVRERKREMVEELAEMHLQKLNDSGAELVLGEGRFVEPRVIEVALNSGGTRRLTAEHIFLDLGSHPAMPDIPGLSEARALTHVEALELDVLPKHLIVLGGGYVGIELAQAYARFGSRVTVIERGPRILAQEDPDASEEILGLFKDDGIDVLFNTQATKVVGESGKEVAIEIRDKEGRRVLDGSHLLVAAGREPNTRGVGLETAGIDLDQHGYIRVNDRLETSAPGVWAAGDCVGRPFFTHVSYDDFSIVWSNLNGGNRSTKGRLVPYCIFTDPPLAHVGLSESEAQRTGTDYRLVKTPIKSALRTWTVSEPRGFMKALIDAKGDRILGFTAFGFEAGELMAVVQAAMLGGLPYTSLRDAVLAHPTMAEGLGALFSESPSQVSAGKPPQAASAA
jgi:pyruvate/2-oxoglutarate dehydrogenase complex dihydrolipoamide dehydrogenase (E3) component